MLGSGSQSTITVTNTGNAPLRVSSAAVNGAQFGNFSIVSDTCTGVSVAAGQSCTVTVQFRPVTLGSQSATLVFTDNGFVGTQSIMLSGNGAF